MSVHKMRPLVPLLHDWLPPVAVRTLKNLVGPRIRFEGEFDSWDSAKKSSSGYDTSGILDKVLQAILQVKGDRAAFERDSVVFDTPEYTWPVLAGLMWAAARDRGALNVLDFGGSLGSVYFQHRTFLRHVSVSWNIVEQKHYVTAGRKSVQDSILKFYETIGECVAENEINIILLSSVLQYVPDYVSLVREIMDVGAKVVILDRTIINASTRDMVFVQHVPATIYRASYPVQSISERSLIDLFAPHYSLMTTFPSLPFSALRSIDSEFKGYIFSKGVV